MWIDKEQTAAVRSNLKAAFPDVKFSVRGAGETLNVTITKSDLDFTSLFSLTEGEKEAIHNLSGNKEGAEAWISDLENKEYYTVSKDNREQTLLNKEAYKLIRKVVKIMNEENWDNSDAQLDYFNVGFITSLSIKRA